MDAIAAASGVSKATAYKHWANKDALLIDVIRKQSAGYPAFESGHPREDMIDLLRHLAQKVKSAELARIIDHPFREVSGHMPFLHKPAVHNRADEQVHSEFGIDIGAQAGLGFTLFE